MKKPCNYIEIEEACNCPFVTTTEIMTILGGVSKSKADKFRIDLENKMDNEKVKAIQETNEKTKKQLLANCFYFKDTRPHKLPIKRVLEEAHIDLNFVRKEANKMRRAINIEKGRIVNEKETITIEAVS